MKVTNRTDLASWLDALTERYTVIAPRLVESELLYGPVSAGAEVVFDFERTVLSPKTFFLPDTQVILKAEKRGKEMALSEPVLEREQVIFDDQYLTFGFHRYPLFAPRIQRRLQR